MTKRALFYTVSAILFFFAFSPVQCAAENRLEAKVKTAYIFNFLQFINWPETPGEDKKAPIKIVVLGNDPVGDLLEELSRSPLEGRGLAIERCPDETSLSSSAHMIFISRSVEQRLPQIIQSLNGKNVLTISDIGQFSRRGGIIGFVKDSGKIKIEINLGMARERGYKIDARLLEIARIIK